MWWKRMKPLFVIETDKVTLEVTAEGGRDPAIKVAAGETVAVGAVVALIEPAGEEARPAEAPSRSGKARTAAPKAEPPLRPGFPPLKKPLVKPAACFEARAPGPLRAGQTPAGTTSGQPAALGTPPDQGKGTGPLRIKAAVRAAASPRAMCCFTWSRPAGRPAGCVHAAGRIGRRAAGRSAQGHDAHPQAHRRPAAGSPAEHGHADHLQRHRHEPRHGAARPYKEVSRKSTRVSLGFMSFFIKACVAALQEVSGNQRLHRRQRHRLPQLPAHRRGHRLGKRAWWCRSSARRALGFAEIEKAIVDYVAKIKENRLELADLEGGTFTISNGGVYGSLLSTPILNTPQSGILGMHRIEKRPVAIDDQVVIRPMMYVALSYDHRIVDGREAVTFSSASRNWWKTPNGCCWRCNHDRKKRLRSDRHRRGPGGYVAAVRAAQLGMKTACVEKEPPGRRLPERGLHSQQGPARFQRVLPSGRNELAAHGIKTGKVSLDLAAMMARKDQVVADLTDNVRKLLEGHKVRHHPRHGRLAAPGRVESSGDENGQNAHPESQKSSCWPPAAARCAARHGL
jgi:2-oxoglutarate dehydrogenase E2 component (dihydrolipoamide succinyltransferase)